jgi:putative ABC transport system permease protein
VSRESPPAHPPRPSAWRRTLRFLGANVEQDVDAELVFHLDMRAAEYERRGLTPRSARVAAERRFGDLPRVRAECERIEHQREQAMSRARMLEELGQDIRWATRALSKRRGFTFTAALTLALGIGANTAIFSVVNAYLFQPLPVRDGDRLYVVAAKGRGSELAGNVSYPNYRDVKARTDLFTDAIASTNEILSVRVGEGEATRHFAEATTGNFFTMLGLKPALGRIYGPADEAQRLRVLVLTYDTWIQGFGGDSSVVGRAVRVNGVPFTVIGVLEPGFHGTRQSLIWVDSFLLSATHAALTPGGERMFERRERSNFRIFVSVRRDISDDQLQAGMRVLGDQLARAYPDANPGLRFIVAPEMRSRPDIAVSGMMPWIAGIFMALVGLVLLIACANVANLLLVRANARQGELALRRAIGATSGRLVRQVITESVLLALLGLLLAIPLTYVVIEWLSSIRLSTDLPARFSIDPDWRVVTFGVVAAVVAGVIAGIGPAIQSSRVALNDVLKEGGRSGSGSVRRHRVRAALVVAQVAVSLVLLICAGLFTQSVRGAAQMDLGFRNTNLLMFTTDVSLQRYDTARGYTFYRQIVERAQALPGVRRVALSRDVPLGYNNRGWEVYFDRDVGVEDNHYGVYGNTVSDGYFATLGYPILEGREFTDRDKAGAPLVAVINNAMARRFWPNGSAVGKQIRLEKDGPPVEIVGVVKDGKYVFINEALRPFLYVPFAQHFHDDMITTILASGDPASLAAPVRGIVRSLDPEIPPFDVKTMRAHLRDGIAFLFVRLAATLATAVGLLGLIQTIVGLYGVISYAVSQRTREIGIRMALGARPWDVLRGIAGQGLILSLIGIAIGAAIAFGVTRAMTALLVGVSATDPVTFVGAAVILALVTLASTVIPARRAARLQPVVALRDGE